MTLKKRLDRLEEAAAARQVKVDNTETHRLIKASPFGHLLGPLPTQQQLFTALADLSDNAGPKQLKALGISTDDEMHRRCFEIRDSLSPEKLKECREVMELWWKCRLTPYENL